MIISKTPYRISLFGGGTDYPDWFNKNNGQVISFTIDKYCYISCRYLPPFFKHNLRIVYRRQEQVSKVDELKHPSVKAVLKYLNVKNNIELHYNGDLPSRSGIGSSSAFTVGLLNALSKYKKLNFSNKTLAEKSIFVEQKIIGEVVGSQDQVSVAYGGFNNIKFYKKNKFKVLKLNASTNILNNLNKNLMLFHTGRFRIAENVSKKYVHDLKKKEIQMFKMYNMVFDAMKLIKSGDLDNLGKMLHETWELKKQMSDFISNTAIDQIYNTGIENGALGGKLLGAGSGGFILFYVPKKNQIKVKNSLKKLLYVPFKFENKGSQIIYNSK